MVRMARLGLAMAPMMSLKVLTNFKLSLVTSYERILHILTKIKTSYGGGEGEGGREVVQDQPGSC